nr:Ig-like domain repeat protein [uncultured Lachnoanaerobaculum sp.]
MNVGDKEKRIISIVICICFLFQIIFRSFVFDSFAAEANPVIALIFTDGKGYYIKEVSTLLNPDGTLILPSPRDFLYGNDESYTSWTPVLIENSFENVRKIILNGGSLEIAEYDISRPPTLATSSVATPSRATSSNAEREDMVIRNGFIEIKENESRNTSITVYKSNIYFEVGSRLDILDGNNRNTISENMRQFISKNGNKNQIFFVSAQPPSTERENGENREIMSKVLSSSRVENIALREGAQSANNSSGERGESGKRSSQKSGRAGIGEGKASQKSGGERNESISSEQNNEEGRARGINSEQNSESRSLREISLEQNNEERRAGGINSEQNSESRSLREISSEQNNEERRAGEINSQTNRNATAESDTQINETGSIQNNISSNIQRSRGNRGNRRSNVSVRAEEENNTSQNSLDINTVPDTNTVGNTDISSQDQRFYVPIGSTERKNSDIGSAATNIGSLSTNIVGTNPNAGVTNTNIAGTNPDIGSENLDTGSTNTDGVSFNIGNVSTNTLNNTLSADTNTGSSRRPGVSISRGTSDNKVNGFITTKNTSVSINDDNFNSNNYSVLVYKNVDGKEVLSETKYSWSSSGDSHRADISFEDDGEYRIAVVRNNSNSDREGVRFEEKVKVDSTAPYITITGVEDLTANARTVSPVVKYSDVNIDLQRSKITLTSVMDGKSRDLIYKAKKEDDGYILNLDPIYIDDNYILTVSIYDLAGNVTEQKVNFSVNKNGATFKFKPEDIVGQYTNKSFKPVIEVWNTDEISIVSATINGMDEPYEFVNGELRFLKSIDKDGKYTFNLEVIDTAGNKASMKPVEIIYDATKPVAMILGVEESKSYEGSVNIILSTELPGDFIESVWLDKRLLAKSEYTLKDDGKVTLNVSVEGNHTIKAQAKDKAGNLSDIVSVSFDIKVPKANLLSAGYIPWAVITLGLLTGLGIAFANYKKGLKREEE